MSKTSSELKNIIEAALFVARRSMTTDNLLSLFLKDSQPTRDEIKAAIKELQDDYSDSGIELKRVARGYRFQSREKYAEWLGRLSEEKPARYSRASMETLAIIAYRQPVTRGDIEQIRGVSVSTDIIRTLTEREWVRQVGHRDVPGKPALYGTTRIFLEYFNLNSLGELPTLDELRDLDEISKELNLPLEFDSASPESDGNPEERAGTEDEDIVDTALAVDEEVSGKKEQTETALSAAPPGDQAV